MGHRAYAFSIAAVTSAMLGEYNENVHQKISVRAATCVVVWTLHRTFAGYDSAHVRFASSIPVHGPIALFANWTSYVRSAAETTFYFEKPLFRQSTP
jgi:hypothetical protein